MFNYRITSGGGFIFVLSIGDDMAQSFSLHLTPYPLPCDSVIILFVNLKFFES